VVRDAERYRFCMSHMLKYWPATGEWRAWRNEDLEFIGEGFEETREKAIDAAMLAAQQQKVKP